jgi:replicative DNA helicase
MDNEIFGGKRYSEILREGLIYVEDRKKGKNVSFLTPWNGINSSGVNGLEWGSLWTIGARPGSGKTMIVSQILRESRMLNPKMDFSILEFQFEMGTKQYASRAFAAETALDYNTVLSAYRELEDFAHKQMIQHLHDTIALEKLGIMRYLISQSMGHKDIEKAIHHYYNLMGGKPLIVTIDHSWLIKQSITEKEKISTLYNTAETLMNVKRDLPVIIIMLSQLNRGIDDAVRKLPGNIANYPTSSDIFGGDALMQCSDMVSVMNRPFIADVPVYGPNGYIMTSDDIAMHIIKSRNSPNNSNLVFMKAEFNRGRMIEVAPPVVSSAPNNGGAKAVKWRTT